MMIVQNVTTGFLTLTAAQPTQYQISKNGAALAAGTGGIALQAVAGGFLTRITPAAGETDTLGRLEFRIMDGGGNNIGLYAFNIVKALPSDEIQTVLGNVNGDLVGDVAGNVVGNLLGSLAVAERIAIANTSFDVPDAVESGLTFRNTLRCLFAVLAGVSTVTRPFALFGNFGQTKIRVTVTLSSDGSRPVVTYDFT